MDARLQSFGGGGPPKWDPRARLGIYLGHSPSHVVKVALVMNPKYGLISTQFHLVLDENFKTVPHLWAGTVPKNWEKLVASSKENILEEFYDVTKTWLEGKVDPSTDPTPSQPSNVTLSCLVAKWWSNKLLRIAISHLFG